ncbi:MAG: hypothetical protein IPH07_10540 [Deltaproteobacteria bacterium]|nr:hypothetical protein [Deltaproteobacteria bacterium]MBK8237175.1 hypothetical protein [Deltaproteobacteria bacterium]MBK8718867.1 hypothetical protein [Deltaproteobacteria bacterium]MBP7291974.1 hypothetical protein [Nannocystaceae bacterium]
MNRFSFPIAAVMTSLLALAACPAGDDSDTGADSGSSSATGMTGMTGMTATSGMSASSTTDGTADSTGGSDVCPGAGGAAADGDACTANGDCMSGVCTIFTDVPLNADATCGPSPATDAGCNTRVTGTVFDFSTRMPVAGATMKVAGALNAITNPGGATALAQATSGADGRVDVTSDVPINQAIAIIALVEGADGYLTATGLASPVMGSVYAVGTGIHDLWLVPSAKLTAWSTALMADAEVDAASLPLGDAGGVIGFVRGPDGLPVAGATVEPADAGSGAIIRYVAADDTITADMTTDTGIFIVIGAAQTGEDFDAKMGGSTIASGTAGSANGAAFTLILSAE